MGKLKTVAVGKKGKTMTEAERQERIERLNAYAYFTFAVYDEVEMEKERVAHKKDAKNDLDDDWDDEAYDTAVDCYTSATDEDIAELEADYAALDALDVFYKFYYDYCVEQLAALKKKIAKFVEDGFDALTDAKKPMKPSYENKLKALQLRRVEDNHHAQETYEAKIKMIKNKMIELGMVQPAEKSTENKTGKKNGKKKHKATIKPKKMDSIDKILYSYEPEPNTKE